MRFFFSSIVRFSDANSAATFSLSATVKVYISSTCRKDLD